MPTSAQALRSLFKIAQVNNSTAHRIFETALRLKNGQVFPQVQPAKRLVAALVFFEPSTRTRFSFEIACHRMGVFPTAFLADASTSVAKGESLHETMNTLKAMRPDLLIVRAKQDAELARVLESTTIPLLSAGWGIDEHPTQALLDAMTIFERRGKLAGERVLYVGDVHHSRVANSGVQLLKKLDAEVACCSPVSMRPESTLWQDSQHFHNMREAMQWATVCIGLRIQKERHGRRLSDEALDEYVKNFRLDKKNVVGLSGDALIMHPGPFVPDEDFTEELLADPRCMVHDQVTNGVYIRMATIGELLGISCA